MMRSSSAFHCVLSYVIERTKLLLFRVAPSCANLNKEVSNAIYHGRWNYIECLFQDVCTPTQRHDIASELVTNVAIVGETLIPETLVTLILENVPDGYDAHQMLLNLCVAIQHGNRNVALKMLKTTSIYEMITKSDKINDISTYIVTLLAQTDNSDIFDILLKGKIGAKLLANASVNTCWIGFLCMSCPRMSRCLLRHKPGLDDQVLMRYTTRMPAGTLIRLFTYIVLADYNISKKLRDQLSLEVKSAIENNVRKAFTRNANVTLYPKLIALLTRSDNILNVDNNVMRDVVIPRVCEALRPSSEIKGRQFDQLLNGYMALN